MAICEPKQKSSAAAGLLEWMAVAAKVRLARGGGGGGGVGEIVQVGSGSSWRVERLLIHALLDVTGGDGARQVEELTVGEAVLRLVEDGIGVDVRRPNPFTTGLPMVASPAPVVACIALYLLVVWLWSSHIKASGQKPRREDPLALRCLVIVHNLFLCCLSLFMAVGLVAAARQYGYSLWGNAYSEGQPAMHFLIYMFYMSKLYEFVDTAIMLLRRNLRQVTYLHIYHHASIAFMWWLICYRFPGADGEFSRRTRVRISPLSIFETTSGFFVLQSPTKFRKQVIYSVTYLSLLLPNSSEFLLNLGILQFPVDPLSESSSWSYPADEFFFDCLMMATMIVYV